MGENGLTLLKFNCEVCGCYLEMDMDEETSVSCNCGMWYKFKIDAIPSYWYRKVSMPHEQRNNCLFACMQWHLIINDHNRVAST